ncbi:MAG: transcription factor S [Candidatus Woesearchaeota archaeon]
MMFCPKCGSLLKIKSEKGKKTLYCSCGYSSKKIEGDVSFKEQLKNEGEIAVVDEKQDTPHAVIDMICPKCEHKKAEFWLVQTRAGDEAETKFYKCQKCGYTWREY